jgi:hypothetical protein
MISKKLAKAKQDVELELERDRLTDIALEERHK